MRRSRSFPVLCDDGRVRRATWTAASADTFFSRRARVTVNGRTVSGLAYVASDFETVTDSDGTARTIDVPSTAADLFYPGTAVRSGVMRFAATGRNREMIGDAAVSPPLRVCGRCAGYYHAGSYRDHAAVAPWHVARRARDHRRPA